MLLHVHACAYHGQECPVVSHVNGDATDHTDEVGIVGFKGPIRSHVFDDIIQKSVHLAFLQKNLHFGMKLMNYVPDANFHHQAKGGE